MKDPVPYEELPAFHSMQILGREIIVGLRALLSSTVHRDKERVRAEYHEGAWRAVLEEKRWLKSPDVLRYVDAPAEDVRVAKIDNRLVRIRTQDYYRFRIRRLQGVIERYAGEEKELVELGCGFGLNMFSLYLAEHWERITGYDISSNAIQAGREAAEFFKADNLCFHMLDLTDRESAHWESLREKTVFTYHTMEQLKRSTAMVIRNLISCGLKRVIHIEPTIELLDLWSPKDLANYLYIKRMDYQDNLLKTIKVFERARDLRIVHAERLHYAPTHRHDATLIVWEPKRKAAL